VAQVNLNPSKEQNLTHYPKKFKILVYCLIPSTAFESTLSGLTSDSSLDKRLLLLCHASPAISGSAFLGGNAPSSQSLTRLRTVQKLGFGDFDFALGFARTFRLIGPTTPGKILCFTSAYY